jgi:predicted O-methyltransferase YrrM
MDVTPELLVELERRYAPHVGTLPGVFSRWEVERLGDGNGGGDKMAADRNNYAAAYATVLADLNPTVVVELGVFQGVSMAMWCELFPEATVVGLDLDFERYSENLPNLRDRGAFRVNSPVLHEWDAYGDDVEYVRDLGGLDLFVDDGPHTKDAIENVVRMVGPLMNPGGVYVIEDYPAGDGILSTAFPDAHIIRAGRLNAARL